MKMVFNFKMTVLALAVLCTALLALPSEAQADTTYFTKREVLKSFFPNSSAVSFETFTPTKRERTSLQRKLGYELAKKSYYIFVATSETASGTPKVDGYAFIDNQMGQHKPITFAVKFSPSGVVLREEVMVYRESHGGEVHSPRFSRQFQGKTAKDSLRTNKDIDSISGATISSRAITMGVKRALVVVDAAIIAPKALRVSQASR